MNSAVMTGKNEKKERIAIVNRGFWPNAPVLGEPLLQLAESLSAHHPVTVITQAEGDLNTQLAEAGRGVNIDVQACKSRSTSNSTIIRRIFDSFIFMLWTLWALAKGRPRIVYVSTNPPVLIPLIVAFYARVLRARYVYHLQDIHPEAANIVLPMNRAVYSFLKWIDCIVMRRATVLITLSEDMASCIRKRSGATAPIYLLDNSATKPNCSDILSHTGDVVFCGNAGRLQRIELIVDAVREYLREGGMLRFTFIGSGVNKHLLEDLALEFSNIQYLGSKPAEESACIISQHEWALLPINDEVTRYAFPSKSSSYALSGCNILAVCGEDTSVARWVKSNRAGLVCDPSKEELTDTFKVIEDKIDNTAFSVPEDLTVRLSVTHFVAKLVNIILGKEKDKSQPYTS